MARSGFHRIRGGTAAFKYVPGQGFIIISDVGQFAPVNYFYAISYDTIRNRAVLTCAYFEGGYVTGTVEFDGSTFYIIDNTQNKCPDGIAGFDEGTGKTVVYGNPSPTNNTSSYIYDTYEYDGSAWTEMYQPLCPDYSCYPFGSMAFIPELNCLATIYGIYDPSYNDGTLLYKNHKWQSLYVENQLVTSEIYIWTYDYKLKSLVLIAPNASLNSLETWELRMSNHCRPVSRP